MREGIERPPVAESCAQCKPYATAALAHLIAARRALKPLNGRLQVGAVKDARQAILDAERALLRITQQGG